MTRAMRAGVIGVGSMGRNHARIYAGMENVELVAVSDMDRGTAERVGGMYGCNPYDDYRMVRTHERLDLVSVVVPTREHFAVGREVIDHGVALLIEKPIAATLEQGMELIIAARQSDVLLTVGHIERFNPAIIALKQQIDDHELGNVFQIVARRVGPFPARIMDVGVAVDLATHEMDILNYLVGSSITRMHAELHRHLHKSHEDMLSAVLRFSNGVIGILDINWLTPTKIRELSVVGERGMFVANYLTQDLTFYENDYCAGKEWPTLATMGVSEGRMIRQKVQRREPLAEELASFAQSVRLGRPPVVSGEEALRALAMANELVSVASSTSLLERVVGMPVG
jgi:UDP-N-acetylglucosamine 3-dehydrogenase